jgi:hypothetical protein
LSNKKKGRHYDGSTLYTVYYFFFLKSAARQWPFEASILDSLVVEAVTLAAMALTNDQRGWVMTCLSGIGTYARSTASLCDTLVPNGHAACVLGASIICVDIVIRQLPGKKDFNIQNSDTFLSASLSLSFGVMVSLRPV